MAAELGMKPDLKLVSASIPAVSGDDVEIAQVTVIPAGHNGSADSRSASQLSRRSTSAGPLASSTREMMDGSGSVSMSLDYSVRAFQHKIRLPDKRTHSSASSLFQMLHFDEDLRHWVMEVSEHFHHKIFIKEMMGQFLYTVFGPLATPFLFCIYGTKEGLMNRYFWPRSDAITIFILGILFSAGTLASLVVYVMYTPDDIADIELKFMITLIFMRLVTISFKYAFMSTANWRRLNRKKLDAKTLSSLLLIGGWSEVTEEQMLKYAEMSFIGVLGSRFQRDSLYLKFVAWPRTREELTALRHRIDGTTKSLFFAPVGKVWQKSISRKAVTAVNTLSGELSSNRPGESQGSTTTSEWRDRDVDEEANIVTASKGVLDAAHVEGGASDDEQGICTLEDCNLGSKTEMLDEDAAIFRAAAEGEMVSLPELFLYILRATLRSERVMIEEKYVRRLMFLFAIPTVMLPCICRSVAGKSFFGETWQSTVVIVGPWPVMLISYWGNVLFIYVAAKDMWRRRSLMRSCAALLTFQRYYRMNCPAEVDSLPVVDITDPHTIEAWRKLRQLCRDWGQFFFWRIQGFTSAFLACVVVSCTDLVIKVTLPTWTNSSNVNLMHILLTLIPAACVLVCIMTQVYLGHEVNQSADRHSFLLNRHRLVMISARQRTGADALARGEPMPCNDDSLQRSIDFLEVLTQDIDAEHRANPIKLVGLYCGYSLLSVLYFIPVGVISSLFNFCYSPETAERCVTVG